LAQRRNFPAFLCSAVRIDNSKYSYRLHVERIDDDIYSPDITVACTAMNKGLEKLIRQHPEQYNWSYKRFNETPGIEAQYREI